MEILGKYIEKVHEKYADLNSEEDLEVYGVSNIEGITKTSHKKSEDLSNYLVLRPGYFAYNPYRINVGSIGLSSVNGLVSPAYIVFKVKEKGIIPELLFEFLKSKQGLFEINKHAKGTVRKALRYDDLCKIELNFPSYEKQFEIFKKEKDLNKKIIKILDKIKLQKENFLIFKQSIINDSNKTKKEVEIGRFLHRIKRPIDLEPNKTYKLVTIKMNHQGVTLRCLKEGKEIKSNMYQVKKGDFILSGIDARNGAFGIIPEELDGAIVTNDFWYFEFDKNIINKHFFLELTTTNWFDEICKLGSDGTTQRIRLQKDKFFNQKILLPSINEQNKSEEIFNKFSILEEKIKKNELSIKMLTQAFLQEVFVE